MAWGSVDLGGARNFLRPLALKAKPGGNHGLWKRLPALDHRHSVADHPVAGVVLALKALSDAERKALSGAELGKQKQKPRLKSRGFRFIDKS
jgi:hypothetical protein